MSFFKELFTAYYDRQTDKIHNCEEGGLVWWHEKGHQQQPPNPYFQYAPHVAITLLAFDFQTEASVAIMFFWADIILDELKAWAYAFKNYKQNK